MVSVVLGAGLRDGRFGAEAPGSSEEDASFTNVTRSASGTGVTLLAVGVLAHGDGGGRQDGVPAAAAAARLPRAAQADQRGTDANPCRSEHRSIESLPFQGSYEAYEVRL